MNRFDNDWTRFVHTSGERIIVKKSDKVLDRFRIHGINIVHRLGKEDRSTQNILPHTMHNIEEPEVAIPVKTVAMCLIGRSLAVISRSGGWSHPENQIPKLGIPVWCSAMKKAEANFRALQSKMDTIDEIIRCRIEWQDGTELIFEPYDRNSLFGKELCPALSLHLRVTAGLFVPIAFDPELYRDSFTGDKLVAARRSRHILANCEI